MRHGSHDAVFADLIARQLCHGSSIAQHEYALRSLDDLLDLRRDHQHAEALLGKLLDQRLDLGLRADIDAACGLIEDEQFRIGAQPAGKQNLLLIAADRKSTRLNSSHVKIS